MCTDASGDNRRRTGWVDASSPRPSPHAEVRLRRFLLPTRDHGDGALVPALRAFLSRRGQVAEQNGASPSITSRFIYRWVQRFTPLVN